ncbi:MAG: EAL domain-containing protein [Magnetococcales bacterium]|nr:EAL domain-containing protein [Magnetococcales bacterium]
MVRLFSSIRTRLLSVLIALTLLPILLLGSWMIQQYDASLQEMVLQSLAHVADKKVVQIEDFIRERQKDALLLSQSPRTLSDLKKFIKLHQLHGSRSEEYNLLTKQQRSYYEHYTTHGNYYDLLLISADGEIVFTIKQEEYSTSNIQSVPSGDSELASVVNHSITHRETSFSGYRFHTPSKESAAYIATPVIDNKQVVGALVLQINNKHFQNVVTDQTGLGNTGETVVATDSGDEITFLFPLKFSDLSKIKKTNKVDDDTFAAPIRLALQGERDQNLSHDYRGTVVLAAWRYVALARMGMVVKVDANEAMANVIALNNWGIVILAAILGMVVITGIILGRSIIVPLDNLNHVTAKIASGDMSQRAEIVSGDEVGSLAASFNVMADKLQTFQKDMESRVIRRTAQLQKANTSLSNEITTRKKSEEARRQTNTLLSAIHQAQSQYIRSTNPHQVFDQLLNEMLSLTNSEFGLIGETIVGTGQKIKLNMLAITDVSRDSLSRSLFQMHEQSGQTFTQLDTLIETTLQTDQPFILNDATNGTHADEDHPPINAFLGLPISQADEVIGLLGFANRPEGYNTPLIDLLKPLITTMANIIHANKYEIQRNELTTALENSRDSLSKAQSIAKLGNWDWNIAGNTLTWSDEIYRIFGLEPQQHQPSYESLLTYIHPDDRHLVEEAVNNALTNPDMPYQVEHRIIQPDGTERLVLERGEVSRDDDGQPTFMRGTIQDITEIRQTEENLMLSKMVIENASEAIVITDIKGIITDINPAYEKITGFSRDEAIGQSPSITQSGRHDSEFYSKMWTDLKQNNFWEGEIWDRRKDGEVFPKWLTINAIKNKSGKVGHYVGIFMDISRQKSTEEKLEQLAFYDPLTKLPNRALFRDRLEHEIELANRNKNTVGLFFIDLDRFKYVNDTLGHDSGDRLLIRVAERTQQKLRHSDTVSRLGGDEFTVILPHSGNVDEIGSIAMGIIKALQRPFDIDGHEVFIGASIGISLFPDDGTNFETMTKNADLAMYQAKEAGRGTYRFYTKEMNASNELRLSLEADLRRAIERQEFLVFYQPKISLSSSRVIGMEALIRWIHPKRGMISPADFIPLAEETGMIIPMGEWILKTACQQAKTWHNQGYKPLRVAVNLSSKQFQDPKLLDMIMETLDETGLPTAMLELEITESVVMEDPNDAIAVIEKLRDIGIHISIDDFGTGYSSLSYLKKFPLHSLKIDQSFVRDLAIDSDDAAIVNSIISMAKALSLGVIAEGVETEEQLGFLKDHQCGEVQGYYFSKPLSSADFENFLSVNDFQKAEQTPANGL